MYSVENMEGAHEPTPTMKEFFENIPDGETAIDAEGKLWERTGDAVSSIILTGGGREEYNVPILPWKEHAHALRQEQEAQQGPTEEQIARREAKREARGEKREDRSEYLEKFTRMHAKNIKDNAEVAMDLSIHAVESTGVDHETAVHVAAIEAIEVAEAVRADNAGEHEPLRELPIEAEGQAKSEIEAVQSFAAAERKEAVSRIFAMNREVLQIDGEIRRLKTSGAKEDDIRRLAQESSRLRREMHKLVMQSDPDVYASFLREHPGTVRTVKERAGVLQSFLEKHGDRKGSPKQRAELKDALAAITSGQREATDAEEAEIRQRFYTTNEGKDEIKGVVKKFLGDRREVGIRTQRSADRVFEDAQDVYTKAHTETQPSEEMRQAEEVINAVIASETPKEDKTDKEVASDFVKAGIVPDEMSPMLDVDVSNAAGVSRFSTANEIATSMQEEMEQLALKSERDEHHLEMGGSVPIDDSEETTHLPAHPYTTHGTFEVGGEEAMEAYGEGLVNPKLAGDFASYVNNRETPRAQEARYEGDWNNPDSWALVPEEARAQRPVLSGVNPELEAAIEASLPPVSVPAESTPRTKERIEAKRPQTEARAERKEGIAPDIKERFYSSLGIKAEVLENDPSFKKLTHEQQLLVLRDLATFSVDDLNDQVKKDIEREWEGQGSISRIGSTAKKIVTFGLLGTKGILTARKKREETAQLAAVGFGEAAMSRQEFLREVASKRLEQDPSISLEADGSLRVNVVPLERASTPEGRETLSRYNTAASAWSKIPERIRQLGSADLSAPVGTGIAGKLFERRIAGLTPAEQVQYEATRSAWEEAESELADLLMKERGDIAPGKDREKVISQELLSYRERIATEQFMAGHPNAEAMLLAMENPPTWTETLGNMLRSAPTYMAYGALARAGAVAVLSTVGAPAVAATLMAGAGIAGYRARKSEIAKAQSLLKERRAAGARSDEDLRENVEIVIDYAANLKRKQAELHEAVSEQNGPLIERLQGEVRQAELRVEEHGSKVRVKRELKEFRDAKHYSRYMESMIARREAVADAAEWGDADAIIRLELIDHKIATASKRMRALKDQGMVNYKRGYAGVAGHVQGYADFAEALAKADLAVSIDDAALDAHIEESLALRRSALDAAAQKRMRNEIRKGVYSRVAYSVAGWFIGAEFFHGGVSGISETTHGVPHVAPGAGHGPEVRLPDEAIASSKAADAKALSEWSHASAAEKLRIEQVTGKPHEQFEYEAKMAEFAALAKGTTTEGASASEAAPAPSVAVPKGEASLANSIAEKASVTEKVASGNIHEVKSGENLAKVMHGAPALAGMSSRASEIAVADFLKFATPEQLKEIGITSGNPNALHVGDHINMSKVDDMLRHMTYRGSPLIEHAKRLAEVNPTATHEAAANTWSVKDEHEFDQLKARMAGGSEPVFHKVVPKDDALYERTISTVAGGSQPIARVEIPKDEVSFEALVGGRNEAPPEVMRMVKEDVDNVFVNLPGHGEHLRGLRAEDVIHKSSPYRWTSVSMNQEYNATQEWLRNLALQTHTAPAPGQSVEQYITETFTKVHQGGAGEVARHVSSAETVPRVVPVEDHSFNKPSSAEVVQSTARTSLEKATGHLLESRPREWSLPSGGQVRLRGITFFQNASGVRPHVEATLTGVDPHTYFDSSKFVAGTRGVQDMEITASEEVSTMLKYAAAYEQIAAHGSPAEATVLLDFLRSESAKMLKHYGPDAIRVDKFPSYVFAKK